MKAVKLWHAPDMRSFRVLWALEELGMPYELNLLPFPPRVHGPEYLEVNPLGTVPAFRDNGPMMTESVAILHYLVARYDSRGLGVSGDHPEYGEWLNWMYFGEATLTFPLTLVLRYSRIEPGKADVIPEDYSRWFLSRLRKVESHLSEREWLVAGRFTVADISVGYALLLADFLGLSSQWKDNVTRYWERLQASPGFIAAKQRQGIELHELLRQGLEGAGA